MANSDTYPTRGTQKLRAITHDLPTGKAASAITPMHLLESTSTSVQLAGVNSTKVVGASWDANYATSDAIRPLWGECILTCDAPVAYGDNIKAAISGKATKFIDSSLTSTTVGNASAVTGGNFTEASTMNDIVQIKSSSAGDTTQTVTLIGTTTATDTVVLETIALNGTSAVDSIKTDWGFILAVKISASCAGTVTVQQKTGPATIITATTGILSKGVTTVTAGYAYNAIPGAVASNTTTATVGIQITTTAGAVAYDSKALNNTTAVAFNTAANTVTEVYAGPVANTRTVAIKTTATADSVGIRVGKAQETQATAGGTFYATIYP